MPNYIFKKRYAFFLLLAAGVLVMLYIPPFIPILQLAPENVAHIVTLDEPFGELFLTNSLIGTFIVDALLITLALYLYRANKRVRNAEKAEDRAPRGLHNTFEAVIEFFFNTTEESAGIKWASFIFPIIMTIILSVVVSNWLELVPGVDSVGILEPAPAGTEGFDAVKITGEIGPIPPIYYFDSTKDAEPSHLIEGAEEEEHEGICTEACTLLPYVRVPSTSLNYTISLAVVAVVMTQVIGFRALGPRYLTKFFAFGTLFSEPLGLIDVIVGFLELIGEFARLLSFSFRLLGNIFAGTVLLFVISFLAPPFAPWLIAFLELFVGAIQAYVFGMLTLTFMSGATVHHGSGGDGH